MGGDWRALRILHRDHAMNKDMKKSRGTRGGGTSVKGGEECTGRINRTCGLDERIEGNKG